MTVGGLDLRRCARAGLMVMGVVYPAMGSADEIRVLFMVSGDPAVEAHVRRLERAVRRSQGPLVMTESLSEAHVVLQFTEYRRSVVEKGTPLFHWRARAKLLKAPDEMTVSTTPLREQFELVVIGEDGREPERALQALERMLSQTLRPRPRPPEKEAI